MSIKNNMGGIKYAKIIFADEIQLMTVINNEAVIKILDGHNWKHLPLSRNGSLISVTPDTANTTNSSLFKHNATIKMNKNELTASDIIQLRSIDIRGCILVYEDNSGIEKVIGSKETPLFGFPEEIIGTKAAEWSGYKLPLSALSLYTQLDITTL